MQESTVGGSVEKNVENNPEWIEATIDAENSIIEGLKSDGTRYIPKLENDILNVEKINLGENGILNDNFINKIDIALGSSKITIKKNSDKQFTLWIPSGNGKYILHPFLHTTYYKDMSASGGTDNMLCGDTWDPNDIYASDGRKLCQANLNFIYMINSNIEGFENEKYHVGTALGHGCEIREWTKLIADGQEFDPYSMTEDIKCSTFRIIQKSHIYAVNSLIETGNNQNYPKLKDGLMIEASTHFLDATYNEGNKIKWRNKLLIKRDNTTFSQIHGAMLAPYYPSFSKITINDSKNSINEWSVSGNTISVNKLYDSSILNGTTVKADTAIAFGDNCVIHQRMIQDKKERCEKSFIMSTTYTDGRYKLYFMPAVTTGSSTETTPLESFNNGDIISVTNERKIEIQ